MLWFDGSIRNAVDKVKSSGVILLVFVHGEDNLSKKYESFLNDEEQLRPEDYVAIKISNNSVELRQFKQIYVSVPIPSLFLIENNGTPIKVVTSDQSSNIISAIKDVVEKRKNEFELKKQNVESTGDAPLKNNQKCDEEAEQKTRQRIKNIGYKLFDIPEEEIKKRLNEIRAFPKFLLIEKPPTADPLLPPATPRIQSARIQFRLPNSEMPSWEFPDQSTLGDVRAYISEKIDLPPNFKLMRTYPRVALTSQDENKTLQELSLSPNATLIVVPVQDKTVQARVKNLMVKQSFVTTVLKTLLQPVFVIFYYFKKHILRIDVNNEVKPKRLTSDTIIDRKNNKKTSTSNIHGFKFEDSDSDGEHPDNGNSTQQQYWK